MSRGDAAERRGRGESRAVRFVHSLAVGSAARRRRWTPAGLGVFGTSLVLVVLGGLATDRLLPIPTLPGSPAWTLAGFMLLSGGLVLSAWCAGLFARARGTPVPVNPPSELIQRGPYAWVRNPMLTGVFVSLVGTGLLLRSASIVLLWTPVYVLLHVLELKWVEEPELERRFGVAYRAYRDAVPMWLPLPGRAAARRLAPVCALAAAASAVAGRLRFQRRYVGATVVMEEGRTFRVFRHLELESGAPAPESSTVLIVRFRFARLPERWNRRLSLIPVPAIGGYPGFRAKVWMSDAEGWWQGVYEWQSSQDARQYLDSPVFRTMVRRAAPGTVTTEIRESRRLAEWLEDHQGHTSPADERSDPRVASLPERVLSLAFGGLIAGGLVLVAAPDWIGLAWLNRGVDRAFFQVAGPTAGAIDLRRWLYGVEGSTLVAFGVLGFAVVRTAVRRREPWARKALGWAVGTWFLLDTSISLAHGVWENAALNVVIALVVLIPIIALRITPPPAPS